VCETPETCAGGLACIPAGAKYCVSSTSTLTCPPGFPVHYLLDPLGSFHDMRTCTACTCGPWQQPGCAGGADFWTAGGCTGSQFGVPADGICQDTSTFQGITTDLHLQVLGGCTPSSSVPTGTVTADNATTICCQ
jgi:hypothetical protein